MERPHLPLKLLESTNCNGKCTCKKTDGATFDTKGEIFSKPAGNVEGNVEGNIVI